jgi:hypothetical protein
MNLVIPDTIDAEIAQYLLYAGLEHRDKGRLMLFAVEKMLKEEAPRELIERCKIAKEAIREKQKKRYQEKMQP